MDNISLALYASRARMAYMRTVYAVVVVMVVDGTKATALATEIDRTATENKSENHGIPLTVCFV